MVTTPEMLNRIKQVCHGFWHSEILFAGAEIGVFNALREGPKTAGELAEALGCDLRGMTILCRALAGLGFLQTDGRTFSASEAALATLATGGPHDQTAVLKHLSGMWEPWGHLAEVVRTGKSFVRHEEKLSDGNMGFESFIEAMHQMAGPSAEAFAALPIFTNAKNMLDVGGGPGTYSIAMARRHPGLSATILDQSGALTLARHHAEVAGVADRVLTQMGDARTDDYGSGRDVVLVSQVLHQFGPEDCRKIIARAAASLAPGGILAVNEFALEEDGASPAMASVFGVNMLVLTEDGWSYKTSEIAGWMNEAGLHEAGNIDLVGRSTLTLGRKN